MYAYFAAFRYDVEIKNNLDHNSPEFKAAAAMHDFDHEQIDRMNLLMIIIELYQLLDFVLQFCLEYKEMDKIEPVRELYKTATRYAMNEMIYDLVPLIPF